MKTHNLQRTLLAVSIGLIAAAASPAQAASTYYFNPLGLNLVANAINDSGLVVGNDYNTSQSFTWLNGVQTGFSGSVTTLTAVNAAGQIAGTLDTGSGTYAARWTGGSPTLLGQLPVGGNNYSGVFCINSAGDVAGQVGHQATVWKANGTTVSLATPAGGSSVAVGINTSGTAVGVTSASTNYYDTPSAVSWTNGKATTLSTLGGNTSFAYGINDAGVIVGSASTGGTNARHAVSWNGGKITDLGLLSGTTESQAYAINSSNQIVGASYLPNNAVGNYAVLWSGGQTINLNSFLDAAAVADGWQLITAKGINDNGWIIGQAYNYNTGHNYSYVLSTTAIGGYTPPPVPEPGTYALTLLGLGAAAVVARRRRT